MVYILGYGGIAVYSLRVGCALACKINSKTTWVYTANLVKWVRYKASNPIEFRRNRESASGSNIV